MISYVLKFFVLKFCARRYRRRLVNAQLWQFRDALGLCSEYQTIRIAHTSRKLVIAHLENSTFFEFV